MNLSYRRNVYKLHIVKRHCLECAECAEFVVLVQQPDAIFETERAFKFTRRSFYALVHSVDVATVNASVVTIDNIALAVANGCPNEPKDRSFLT